MALETPGCPAANALPPLASRFLKVADLPWKPTQVEGIDMKILMQDKESGLLTALFRWQPGTELPLHEHVEVEQTYVLEGSIEMGVRGGKTVTLTPGQTFYEGPDDIHTVGRNTSLTEPARFLVFLLKNSDAPILTPLP